MKRLFWIGVVVLVLFELANVYFIMPLPYSQRVRSIDLAYFLYRWRWAFRALGGALVLAGLLPAWRTRRGRVAVPLALAVTALVAFVTNVRMSADHMFRQPVALRMVPLAQNRVADGRLVVGVASGGDARAYPIQFIGYHHQVRDSLAGRPILVSYCTVCRTGRVYSPLVDGHDERYRLVGMDHFNAMFEDATTKSWWRQANGEAVAGPKKGSVLGEVPSVQVTLAEWRAMHPNTRVMQADSAALGEYTKSYDYERGESRSALTGTDTVSWHDKAWVVGLTANGASRAYDWNRLKRERLVQDTLGTRPVLLVLAHDSASFFAYERPSAATRFALRGDSLVAPGVAYAVGGGGPNGALVPVAASQEFWHSWRTFHPETTRY